MTEPVKLAHKIAMVIDAVSEVEKKGHNDHFNYAYATAEDILRVIRGPLANQNVALMPSLSLIEERDYTTSGGKASVITTAHVDFTFVDGDTGEMFKCSWAGQGDDPADKGLGKAYTNAVKTFLRQTFLLPQGDDPEADSSTDKRAADRASSGPRVANAGGKPSEKQLKYLDTLGKQRKPTVAQLRAIVPSIPADLDEGWMTRLSKGEVSTLIERLKDGDLPEIPSVPIPTSDMPVDDGDFVHPPAGDTSDLPIEDAA